jgi:hypothetical protein
MTPPLLRGPPRGTLADRSWVDQPGAFPAGQQRRHWQQSEHPAISSSSPVNILSGTSRRTRLIAVIVACALFMQNLDSTVIATALPTMARVFGVEPVRMNVALTSYLLSLAVFIPASGWIADRYGTRTVFRGAIAVFTVDSVLCGRADTLSFLVASRILQGIGGAMMVQVGRLVLLRTAPPSMPMKVRHQTPGNLDLRARKDNHAHAHAPATDRCRGGRHRERRP